MSEHRVPRYRWVVMILVLGLIAGHGLLLRAISAMPLPMIVLAAAILLIVMLHLGILRLVYERLRRGSRR